MGDNSPPSSDPDISPNPGDKGLGNFWSELRRRKVVRVAITYAIVAWLIMQVAGLTFEGFGVPIWAFRFVVLMVWLFFPVAIILTWAFELTPEGIKTTKSARQHRRDESATESQQRKRNWMAYGLGTALPALIFAILALFFYLQNRSLVSQMEINDQIVEIDKSIAVLPFDNRSKLDDDEYFTDGIHDDLLTQISKIKEIKTISRTSVMVYKDTTKNLKTIGDELGVSTILEGGVQRSGDMIRINAQLIDAATDAHLWAKTYDREMTAENVFHIQSEIAMAIADALKAVLSPEEKTDLERLPTKNLDALEAYFQAAAISGRGKIDKSIELLDRAISLDPDFADAYADSGRQILNLGRTRGWPREELFSQVQTLIDKALALDPRNAIAYRTIGRLNMEKRNFKEAEEAFSKAIELRPSYGEAYANYAETHWRQGKIDESFEIMKRGLKVDPHGQFLKEKHILLLYSIGQTEEADALFDNYLEEHRDDFSFGFVQISYRRQKKYDQAVKVLRKWHNTDPANKNVPNNLNSVYYNLGDEENAVFWRKRYIELVSGKDGSLSDKLFLLIAAEKWQEAESFLRDNFSPANASEIDVGNPFRLMHHDFKQGRSQAPMNRYKYLFPQVFEAGYIIEEDVNSWIIKDIAVSLLAAGLPEKAKGLLEQLIKIRERNPDSRLLKHLYSLTGHLESALKNIQENPMEWAAWYNHPDLENLRGHPDFEALMKEPLKELQRQRQRLAEWEANGELAPIPQLPVKQ